MEYDREKNIKSTASFYDFFLIIHLENYHRVIAFESIHSSIQSRATLPTLNA